MKIAILTHPLGANYGGILQAWALSTYLESLGHHTVVLNRENNLPLLKRIIKRGLVAIGHKRYTNPKYTELVRFVKQNINYSEVLSTDQQMSKYIKRYGFDLVIVGSDQVWRADFARKYGYNYFLDFVPERVKKISYAASFGLSNWEYNSEETARIVELLSKFAAISVREDEGVELCNTYLNTKADHVLDPTLLLSTEDYDRVTSKRIVPEDYVFVYWLGGEDGKEKALAKATVDNKRIVDISLRGNSPLLSVEDWLSYIKYADVVVTDSFHGCVFSLLFHKTICLSKNDSGGNGRLKSLFKMLNIEEQEETFNYDVIDRALECERIKSYEFIKQVIQ